MKIVYIAEWNAFINDGVNKKISAQCKSWRLLGADVLLILISPPGEGELSDKSKIIFKTPTTQTFLGKIFKSKLMLFDVHQIVKKINPDLIYYRNSSWTPGLLRVFTLARKLIVEINSDEARELVGYSSIKRIYKSIASNKCMYKADAFVCVSQDVSIAYEKYQRPILVLGNSYDVRSVRFFPVVKKIRPILIMVTSGAQPWHGIDIFEKIAEKIPECDFHVIGIFGASKLSNFKYFGYLSGEELSEQYRLADFGVASLALFRINISEISPLKTREYMAYGLPIIGAYTDTDIPPDYSGYLRLNPSAEIGDESIANIRNFIEEWRGRRIDKNDAIKFFDIESKEKKRLEFMKSIFNE